MSPSPIPKGRIESESFLSSCRPVKLRFWQTHRSSVGHISGIQMAFDLIEDERNIRERVATQVRSDDLSTLMMDVMGEI